MKLADSWLTPSCGTMCASEFGTLGFATVREPLMTSHVALGYGHGVRGSDRDRVRLSGAVSFSTSPRRTWGWRRLISGISFHFLPLAVAQAPGCSGPVPVVMQLR